MATELPLDGTSITTMRPDRRRRTLILRIALTLAIVLPLLGMLVQATAATLDAQRFPPPGRMVDVGGRRVHLYVTGAEHPGPTILLEAGAFSAAPQWEWVQTALAERYRVVAYDRPGLGWSDADPQGFAAERIAQDLHTALQREAITGPYILVGHSLGGLFVRVFTGMYPEDVAGVVLVDATHPDQAQRSHLIATNMTNFLNTLRPLPVIAPFGLTRLLDIAGPLTAGASADVQAVFRTFLANPRHINTMIAELDQIAELNAAVHAAGNLGDRPLIVLSADVMDGVPNPEQYRVEWLRLQGELAELSYQGIHRIVPGATHLSLVFDQHDAEAVVTAVVEVAAAAQVAP